MGMAATMSYERLLDRGIFSTGRLELVNDMVSVRNT